MEFSNLDDDLVQIQDEDHKDQIKLPKKNRQMLKIVRSQKNLLSKKKSVGTSDPELLTVNQKYYHLRNSISRSISKKPFVLDCLNVTQSQKVLTFKDYNGLGDKHLQHFFMRQNRKKDLKKSGIIDKEGNMVPDFELRKLNFGPSI